MAAHRYWRVLLSSVNTNSRAAVVELQMRASVGGANLCVGGTGIASGTVLGSIAGAFDGNAATEWQSNFNGGAAWLGYDFGSAADVVEISLQTNNNSSMQSAWGLLQWSSDAVGWVTLAPLLTMGTASTIYVFSGFADVAAPQLVGAAARLPTAWPSGPVGARVPDVLLRFDPIDGGPYRIAGTVSIAGTPDVPVRRRVLLFAADSYRLVRSAWSDPATGAYLFSNLRFQKYIVLGLDHTAYYNATVADAITPTL